MITYKDNIVLPGDTTLETTEEVLSKFQEVGVADQHGRRIIFEVEADDLWNLRDVLADLAETLYSNHDIELVVDRAKASE